MTKHSIIYRGWIMLLITMVLSCSAHIPPEIKQPIEGAPSVSQVRDSASVYTSQTVRWGGIILQTENKQDTSRLTIVAFPLDDDGEPRVTEQSSGRFIAIIDEFLEPLVYSRDREITVIGHLLRTETLDVGEFAYEYPVLQVDHYFIWPVKEEPVYVGYPPYWWYDPWYPYYSYPYPYYLHHHRR